jgi:hypothetical protein
MFGSIAASVVGLPIALAFDAASSLGPMADMYGGYVWRDCRAATLEDDREVSKRLLTILERIRLLICPLFVAQKFQCGPTCHTSLCYHVLGFCLPHLYCFRPTEINFAERLRLNELLFGVFRKA